MIPSHLTSLGKEGTVYPQRGSGYVGSCSSRHFISFNSLNNSVRHVLLLPHLTDDGRKEATCPGSCGSEDSNPGLTDPKAQLLTHSLCSLPTDIGFGSVGHDHGGHRLSSLPVIPEPPPLRAACQLMASTLHLVGPSLTFPRPKGQSIQDIRDKQGWALPSWRSQSQACHWR